MKNIFILYIPSGNHEALIHYQDTIVNKVSLDRIFKYIDENLKSKLRNVFGTKPIATWGSRESDANRSRFEKMQPGDNILIVEGDTIKLLGKFAVKTINPDLSRELWKNLKGNSTEGWNLIYFIANPVEINLPFDEFKKLLNFSPDYQLRGFTSLARERLEDFYSKYDDLYSILLRLKKNEPIEEKKEEITEQRPIEAVMNEDESFSNTKELSEHVKIQWKLIRMGLKAGSKIWIPKNDQSKISKEYDYKEFEEKFTTGLDVDAKYVENIDVVWKEEFRIDAAFEIENTTSIYSGLLRFSGLKIVAPNSNYPLFVVAPNEKRKKVIDQIKRPTFKKIEFDKKVRYLSYDAINEIETFFESSNYGLNVNLLMGKSEEIK